MVEKFGEAGAAATRLDPSRRSAPLDSIYQPDLSECIGSGVDPLRGSEQLETDGSTTGVCPGCLERRVLSNSEIPPHQLLGQDHEDLGERI